MELVNVSIFEKQMGKGRGERTTAEAEMSQSRKPNQGWVTDDKREKLNRE